MPVTQIPEGAVRKKEWRRKTSGELREERRKLGTACVGSPRLIGGESYAEAAAKLPENAAITHWGSRVITESFCPHLPTVISPNSPAAQALDNKDSLSAVRDSYLLSFTLNASGFECIFLQVLLAFVNILSAV